MRQLITIIALLFTANYISAQTTFTGKLTDGKKGIPGISITLKDTYDGTVSDSTGAYRFTTTEKGEGIITFSGVGYKAAEQKVVLSGGLQTINISLKEEMNELTAVIITAGSFEAGDKKRAAALTSIDIYTTASANADVTAAFKTLPGAQQVGESEGLFVRGGTAAETKTYIDGTLVNNFFYSSVPDIAQRGRFAPGIFKGTVFSTGGYSALYGQALSSALILETVDLPEQSSANLSVSVVGLSGGIDKLSKNKRSSYGANYGYTNPGLALKVLDYKQEFSKVPAYHTGDANFRIKTSATGMLKYYGYFSGNAVGIRTASYDTLGYKDAFRLSNFNMYHNLSYRENLPDKWKFSTGVSYTNNKDNIHGSLVNGNNEKVSLSPLEYKNFDLEARGTYINGRVLFEKRLRGLSALRFGSEYNFSQDRSHYTLYNGDQYPNGVKDALTAGFAEADIYVTGNLAAKLGTRLEHSSLLHKNNIAPRLSLAYKTGKAAQASLAYGIFYQNPERRYLPSVNDVGFTKATHYIAQYQRVTALQTLRGELYYKKYENLLKTAFVSNALQTAANNNGYGYARGFDFFWRDKKTLKNVDYWVSYSYLDTKRDFLNYPYEIQPSFAAKHTLNVVAKRFFTKLKTQFNANYTWASGRPYYNIRYNSSSSKFGIYDEGRTIPYNSLSLSVNYLPNIFKQNGAGKFTVFVFSITNALGSNQVYGYNYSYNGYRKDAIVPATRTFIFLGAFLSFGVDRSQDVINSNL